MNKKRVDDDGEEHPQHRGSSYQHRNASLRVRSQHLFVVAHNNKSGNYYYNRDLDKMTRMWEIGSEIGKQ